MAEIKDAENTILMELKNGTVTIELLPDIAPGHCERMKELARSGKYDNVSFHRVIEGLWRKQVMLNMEIWKMNISHIERAQEDQSYLT